MIIFQNPGEIDIRLITTLGVNVKETSSPIGFFGTGLKYAIAVLLREGNTVVIHSGKTKCEFRLNTDMIRGKSFDFIQLHQMTDGMADQPQTLGFTTELGKNWSCLQAFRELWSNCKDEGGEIFESSIIPAPIPGLTTIAVMGETFEAAYATRSQMILAESGKKLLWSNDDLEVYAGSSRQLFYRGIAVCSLGDRSKLTYNILKETKLTEDRTVHDLWSLRVSMGQILAHDAPEEVLTPILESRGSFEHVLDFDWTGCPNPALLAACRVCYHENILQMNESALRWFKGVMVDEELAKNKLALSAEQDEAIKKALVVLGSAGYLINYPIIVCSELGQGVLAKAEHNKILLTPKVFQQQILLETILEEWAHLTYGFSDHSREFQNWLFRQVIRQIQRTESNDLPF